MGFRVQDWRLRAQGLATRPGLFVFGDRVLQSCRLIMYGLGMIEGFQDADICLFYMHRMMFSTAECLGLSVHDYVGAYRTLGITVVSALAYRTACCYYTVLNLCLHQGPNTDPRF